MIARILAHTYGLYYLLAGVVLLVLFGLLAMQNVSRLAGRYVQLHQHVYEIEHADEILLDQQVALKQLDMQLTRLRPNRIQLRNHNHFVQYTSSLCDAHEVKLVALPHETIEAQGAYQVARISLSLEGSFHDLLQVLHTLEQEDRVASIQTLEVRIEEVRRGLRATRYLIMDVVVARLV